MSHTPSHKKHPIIASLPRPPGGTVDATYMASLVRALELALDDITDISPLRGASLYLAPEKYPLTGNLLRAGETYNDDGTLKIVLEDVGYAPSFLVVAELGDVTVSV
jgi:hypothetical protein